MSPRSALSWASDRAIRVREWPVAVDADFHYLRSVMGMVGPRVLEIGSRAWQGDAGNMRIAIEQAGRVWTGCDIEAGHGVDFTLDLLDDDAVGGVGQTWSSVLLFNLLEHVYEPILALRNAMRLVEPGGSCVICGPAVWELHDYPRDYWRPLPDFYIEFARREGHELEPGALAWVLNEWPYLPGRPPHCRVIPVGELTQDGQKQLPSRLTATQTYGPARTIVSVGIQRALNLTGRVTRFPNVGLGVVIRRPADPTAP